ncbi:MAG TPA: protein phosphatase 2C domain-containing protein [Polyangiaceae bacterium]|jgi:protein phosphatase
MAGETEITLPSVDVAERSDPGRDPTKQINEDACGFRETPFGVLAVVCDGMGGHVGGREASTSALASIFESFERAPPGSAPRDVLRDAIRLANVRVRGLAVSDPAGGRPGSTVVAVLVHAAGTEVAHVGDSRVYLAQQGQIFQVTRDHSMVQEMVQAKILTPEQAVGHPDANKITRALGIDDDVEVDLRPQSVAHVAGDTFVLCSDGLSDLVEMPEILRIVTSDPPEQAAGKLVDLANARGGYDNVTVVVVRPRTSAAVGPMPILAPTIADSQLVTIRPTGQRTPLAVIPAAPPPTPAAHSATRKKPLLLAAVALGALLVIGGVVAAMAGHGTATPPASFDASPPPLGNRPGTQSSVDLVPVAPPEPGALDASDIAPLDPAGSAAPASSRPHRASPHPHGKTPQ